MDNDQTSAGQATAFEDPAARAGGPTGPGGYPSDPQTVSGDLSGPTDGEAQNSAALVASLRAALAAANRETKKAAGMERMATRHAIQCDAEVAEADARLAQRDADVKRLEAHIARLRVELHEARSALAESTELESI